MTAEVLERVIHREPQVERGLLSSHPCLDKILLEIDQRVANLSSDLISSHKVLETIGFPVKNASLGLEVRGLLRKACALGTFNSELRNNTQKCIAFNRETLLLARVIIEAKGQNVPWPDVPYVAYHYIEDPLVRDEINRPKNAYDQKRQVQSKDQRRVNRLRRLARSLLLPLGAFDLSSETILSNIPEDFMIAEYSFTKRRDLTPDQVEQMCERLSAIAHQRPLDPISAVVLEGTGFDVRDIDTVIKHHAKLMKKNGIMKSGEVDDYCFWEVSNILGQLRKARETIPGLLNVKDTDK